MRDLDITETPQDLVTLADLRETGTGEAGERFRLTNLSAHFRRVVIRVQRGSDPAPEVSARGRVARPGESLIFDTANGNKIWAWVLDSPKAACILEEMRRWP